MYPHTKNDTPCTCVVAHSYHELTTLTFIQYQNRVMLCLFYFFRVLYYLLLLFDHVHTLYTLTKHHALIMLLSENGQNKKVFQTQNYKHFKHQIHTLSDCLEKGGRPPRRHVLLSFVNFLYHSVPIQQVGSCH